jgi:anti-sigma regulatory factor (Ser/Thr protein kinase)
MSTGRIAPSAPAGVAAPVPPSHHGHSPERWPLHHTITLGALDSAVRSARTCLRQLLLEWNHPELAPDASVVISELVTNAVIASAQLRPAIAPVQIWLGSDTRCLLLAVADASPWPPVRLNLSPDAEAGRGLALVEALTSRWSWHPTTAAGLVKVVWAEWHLPSRNGGRPTTAQPHRSHAD